MNDVIVAVNNIGKSYLLYNRPQDRLKQMLFWRFGKQYGREFWALRGVTFEIQKGESVGIIGRNGSGKSTLLQIIAGTLAPTMGEVRVQGRLAALLELGSGFNPEFTGRENVFLNGAILGMSREEVEAQFDDIAAFADIGDFIDQPVKLYSSGMVVRLAFAVQAIVQKDILIVDEALAVGDEAFQRKCYARLEDFQNNGGTILLVTHNAQVIVRQCQRCLFLHGGQLILDGPSKPVTDIYQRFIYGTPRQQHETLAILRNKQSGSIEALLKAITPPADTPAVTPSQPSPSLAMFDSNIAKAPEIIYGTGEAEIFDLGMYDESEHLVNVLVVGETYTLRYRVRFFETAWNVKFGVMFKTVDGIEVAGINSVSENQPMDRIESGHTVEVNFRLRMNLAPGTYYLNSGLMADTKSGSGFLHRRVDVMAVRVIPPNGRTVLGIAHLDPHMQVRFIGDEEAA